LGVPYLRRRERQLKKKKPPVKEKGTWRNQQGKRASTFKKKEKDYDQFPPPPTVQRKKIPRLTSWGVSTITRKKGENLFLPIAQEKRKEAFRQRKKGFLFNRIKKRVRERPSSPSKGKGKIYS